MGGLGGAGTARRTAAGRSRGRECGVQDLGWSAVEDARHARQGIQAQPHLSAQGLGHLRRVNAGGLGQLLDAQPHLSATPLDRRPDPSPDTGSIVSHRAGTLIQSAVAHKSRAMETFADKLLGVKTPRFDNRLIGRRIREAREAKGLTTETLATASRIGVDSLYKKQRGVAPWYFDELHRVCEVLNAPRYFPILDWNESLLVERLLRESNP